MRMRTAQIAALLASLALPAASAQTDDAAPASAPAAESQPSQPPASLLDLLESDRATGDWIGARAWLEEHGLEIALTLTSLYQQNAHGGRNTHHAHDVSGVYDLEFTFDTHKAGLWAGGSLYAYAAGGWKFGAGEHVGDLMGVNYNATGDEEIVVRELWYEHNFADALRVRVGRITLTLDFDTNAFANYASEQFLHSALVNSANIPFPDYGMGAQAILTPCEAWYAAAGVADADADEKHTGLDTAFHGPDNTFSMVETGFTPTWQTPVGKLPGHYRAGLWYDPQPKEAYFDDVYGMRRHAPIRRDDTGFYLNMDQLVFRENPADDDDEQGLGLFARYAHSHADVNELEDFWSIGAQYQGPIPLRDDDVLAFGAAQGLLSDSIRRTGLIPHRETALECYYRLRITPWLSISPDFQWILRPGGFDGPDAFVAGLRMQAVF